MIVVIVAAILQSAPSPFSSPRDAFQAAEEHYQAQRFDEAVAIYERYTNDGIEDGVLYYNLGNAYFKAGRLGRAVLNYERALRLLPGDADVRANLAFANELITDDVDERSLPGAVQWVVDSYRAVTPNALARLLSLAALVGGGLVSVLLIERLRERRNTVLLLVGLCGVIALVSATALVSKLREESVRVEGVVLSENAYVRSGPGEANPRLAEIHEGLKVRVLGERSGWLQITLDNGLTGWARSDDIEPI
jgi:tetratricopeptide (TPR) repeat protein